MSYVAMEEKVCPVCCIKHSFDCGILLDRRLNDKKFPTKSVVTGWGLCEADQKMWDNGYIAIIGANNPTGNSIKLENADRTGDIVHLKRSVFNKIFDTQVPDDLPMVFADKEMIQQLKNLQVTQ